VRDDGEGAAAGRLGLKSQVGADRLLELRDHGDPFIGSSVQVQRLQVHVHV
jgi:hypothetical protein